jgi:hypothetical protein
VVLAVLELVLALEPLRGVLVEPLLVGQVLRLLLLLLLWLVLVLGLEWALSALLLM